MSRLPPKIEQDVEVANYAVRPISRAGITYTLSVERRESSEGGIHGEDHVVTAVTADGRQLWKTTYASFEFIPGLETDVQEVFPVNFYDEGDELIIKLEGYTENDRVYRIMMSDGGEKLKSYS